MRQTVPFLALCGLLLCGCSDAPGSDSGVEGGGGSAGLSAEEFCRPALARVDSFMATYEDREWGDEKYGGTAVVGMAAELEGGMNVFTGGDAGAIQHQLFVNLMTLLQYDENLELRPYLAESWEVSADQTEVTFRLRDDVFWHDGEPTTAEDVAFTFHTATDTLTGFPNSSFFQFYDRGDPGVEVLDRFTIRFRMRRHAGFLDPWAAVAIMPRHLLGEVAREELALHPFGSVCPVGNGPFRFVSHSPGDRWVFEANPAFPAGLDGRPYLDRYVGRIIPEHTTLLNELLGGDLDLYVSMLPQNAARAREEESLRVESFPYRSFLFAAWNSRVPKLADANVRRALTLGTNRELIMEGVRGGEATLANTGVPPFHWSYDASLSDSLPYDPDQARRLLTDAGWVDRDGDGIREDLEGEPLQIDFLTTENQEWQDISEIMQAQLREVGVDLQLRVQDFGSVYRAITSPEREFEGFVITFEVEFHLDERNLFHSEAVNEPFAFSGTNDPELDSYLDTLQLVLDRVEARPLWESYQRRILELQPFTFLYWTNRIDGGNERLMDTGLGMRGEWANIRHWWILPEGRRTP